MLVVVTKIITYFGIQRSCAYIRAFCEVARSFKVQMLAVVVTWEGKSQLKFLSLAGLIRCSIFTSPRIVPYFEALPITEPFVTPPPLCFTRWWHSHRFQSQLAFPQHIYSGHLRVKSIILIKGGKCKEREIYIYKGHLHPKFWGPIYQFLFSLLPTIPIASTQGACFQMAGPETTLFSICKNKKNAWIPLYLALLEKEKAKHRTGISISINIRQKLHCEQSNFLPHVALPVSVKATSTPNAGAPYTSFFFSL